MMQRVSLSKSGLTLVVMAAGMGSRYGGEKQIAPLGPQGEWLMDYALYDAHLAGFREAVVITRSSLLDALASSLRQRWGNRYAFRFVEQPALGRPKPWGTTHAVLCTEGSVHTPFAVINADDYYGREAFASLAHFLSNQKPDTTQWALVGYRLGDTLSPSGHVSRGLCKVHPNGQLISISERKRIARTPQGNGKDLDAQNLLDADAIVSMNCWGLTPAFFAQAKTRWATFYHSNQKNPNAEWHLPHFVEEALKDQTASVQVLTGGTKWMGVTYANDKHLVQTELKALKTKGLYPTDFAKNQAN